VEVADSSKKAAAAAYGGSGWSPRTASLGEEIGSIWARCGIDSEHAPLRAVLLHRPGGELAIDDADTAQMLAVPDAARAAAQHDALADAYRAAGIVVHHLEPRQSQPNLMFCADLFAMTPAGAILARPASTVRAGEEREVARRLADMGVPILRSVCGSGTFEGADLMWLDARTAIIGRGLRTNDEGARQVAACLAEQGVESVIIDLPHGAMHLMGQLRIVDQDLAFVRRDRVEQRGIDALTARGCDVHCFPDEIEMDTGFAHNFVVLAPRRILMPARNPKTQRFYAAHGVECVTVDVAELAKAAGAIGCLTGVIERGLNG
jgi:arginine deiminase